MKKKLGRPSDQTKRLAIIDAASQRFFDAGYAATSIEQVASDAGVSKVTIYNHFGDKRALFAASVAQECEKMHGYFSIEDTPEGSIGERLTRIGTAMVDFLSRPEMIAFDRRIAAETETNPDIGAAFLEAGPHRMSKDFAEFLKHANSMGELTIENPDLAGEQFVAMCRGMGDLERRFGAAQDPEELRKRIEGAVTVFMKAYAA